MIIIYLILNSNFFILQRLFPISAPGLKLATKRHVLGEKTYRKSHCLRAFPV